jgi:hypothetical protein
VQVSKYRLHWVEEFEYARGVTRSRNLKKDRQYNNKMNNDKRTNNDIQNTTQKTKRLSDTNPTISRNDLWFFGRASISYSTSGTFLVIWWKTTLKKYVLRRVGFQNYLAIKCLQTMLILIIDRLINLAFWYLLQCHSNILTFAFTSGVDAM